MNTWLIFRAVCGNFARRGGGGANLGYLKNRGAAAKASGGALEDNVKNLVW